MRKTRSHIPMSKVFYRLCYGDIMENADGLLKDGTITRLPTRREVEQIADMISNGINWSETTDIAIEDVMNRAQTKAELPLHACDEKCGGAV